MSRAKVKGAALACQVADFLHCCIPPGLKSEATVTRANQCQVYCVQPLTGLYPQGRKVIFTSVHAEACGHKV